MAERVQQISAKAMDSTTLPSRGIPKLLNRLQENMEAQNFYEAHQLYKTLCNRYLSSRKYCEALDLLISGSHKLLDADQLESGADLALLVLHVYEKMKEGTQESDIKKIGELHSKIPASSPERQTFVVRALKCINTAENKCYSPMLHSIFAHNCWQEKRHTEARYHFLYAADGESFGKFLVEFQHDFGGKVHEVDTFVAQAVLQLLCLRDKSVATMTFTSYTHTHPHLGPSAGPPFVLPLLNFIWFLLLAVNGGKVTIFTILCEQYLPSIERDAVYKQYLEKIGQNFFGLPAAPDTGIWGSIVNSLMTGTNDSSEDPESVEPRLEHSELD